jgi:ribosomal protein L37E
LKKYDFFSSRPDNLILTMGFMMSKSPPVEETGVQAQSCKDCGKTGIVPDAKYCSSCGAQHITKGEPTWAKKK